MNAEKKELRILNRKTDKTMEDDKSEFRKIWFYRRNKKRNYST